MRYVERPMPPPLDRWVRCVWFLRTDGRGPQPVIPDGRLEIVVHRAEPFERVHSDGIARAQAPLLVSGQLTRPVGIGPRGPADVVGVRFRTAAARDALGLPLDELTDAIVPLADVVGAWASDLASAARSSDPVTALANVLGERIGPRRAPRSGEAVARLARGDRVVSVAAADGVSVRTLERRMRADVGLAPKTIQRVMRFRAFYGRLHDGATDTATAALEAGYYDQSHATRDFRSFTGCSPREHFGGPDELAAAFLSHSS